MNQLVEKSVHMSMLTIYIYFKDVFIDDLCNNIRQIFLKDKTARLKDTLFRCDSIS